MHMQSIFLKIKEGWHMHITVDGKNRTRLLPPVLAGLACFYGVSGGAISGRNERFFNISTVLDS